MKICSIITCYLPSTAYGGTASVLSDHAAELAKNNNSITVLTSNILDPRDGTETNNFYEEYNNYVIRRFHSIVFVKHFSAIFSLGLLIWLRKHRKEFDVFYIVYARELIPLFATMILTSTGSRIFLQAHGMLNRREGFRKIIDLLITKHQLSSATKVIVLQEVEKRIIQEISPEAKCEIIGNGIQIPQKLPLWKGGNSNSRTILFLARLHPRKRVLTFIEAAAILVSENKYNCKFRIVGPDGGDDKKAKEMVLELGLNNMFEFVGSVSHEIALTEYSNADIYVLPSENEPFAITVSEALAIGIPVVITDSTQNLELYKKYDAVEICGHDPDSLVKSIKNLIMDPQLCKRRSINGKKLVVNELSLSIIIKKIENLYSSS